jgi:hypothetical protein
MLDRITVIFIVLTLAAASPALAGTFSYESHGKRDPFVSLVGPDRSSATRLGDALSVEDIRLEGIATDSTNNKMAVMNGEIVRAGYRAGEIEIKSITDKTVTLSISGKEYTVSLPEQGGVKIVK